MKFTINTKEFKNVMKLVKTVADSSANAKVTAHNICLLRAFPVEKQLKLEFCLNDSFLSYLFEDVKLDTSDETEVGEITRSVDLGSLSSLKFSGATVNITLGRSREGNTLEFQSGRLNGKLILSHADIEKQVEKERPEADSVELDHTFSITDFLSALSAHNYGAHHNAEEAHKRPVRIHNKKYDDGANILFVSKDRIAAASFSKPMTTPYKEEFSFYLRPKPFQAVLNALSHDVSPVFNFGIAKTRWRLHHGQIDVWFPNIIQQVNYEMEDLKNLVESLPCFSLTAPVDKLKSALSDLEPFTSDGHLFSKEDMPIIKISINKDVGSFSLNTSKAKDVVAEIEDSEFTATKLTYDPEESLNLNFKYLSECVAALDGKVKVKTSKKKKKDDEDTAEDKGRCITVMWWPYQDRNSPTKGKAVCLKCDGNYYWISRVREQVRNI